MKNKKLTTWIIAFCCSIIIFFIIEFTIHSILAAVIGLLITLCGIMFFAAANEHHKILKSELEEK